ncbi:MAG TPA: rod shape-determining protein MreD [Oscillospiraceae bacterium]|nr:rod shape-determining protein MreD [Oscillospiraceae bacterium]HRW57608.1 rod shape-determining protein MreD [Oscillospiraceae bacterium]
MTRDDLRNLMKYGSYVLILFFSYILQATPGIGFLGVKPMLVLPACICIAFLEDEFSGGLLGVFAGIFCDFSSDTVFGFNALLFLIFCVGAGLAAEYAVRRSLINVMLFSLTAVFLRAGLEFVFSFALYRYEGAAAYFYTVMGPEIVLTSVFTPLYFFLTKLVHHRFRPSSEREQS